MILKILQHILPVFFVLVMGAPIIAQNSEDKQMSVFEDAMLSYTDKNYANALTLMQKLLKRHPDNSSFNYIAGLCLYNSKTDRISALPYFEKALVNADKKYNMFSYYETSAPYEAYFYAAHCYQLDYQLDNATFYYGLFLQKVKRKHKFYNYAEKQVQNCAYAKQQLADPVNVQLTNLGDKVNSKYRDFSPVISLDEKKLFFTSRRLRKDSSNIYFKDFADGQYFEDIYYSEKDENGNWKEAKLVEFRSEEHTSELQSH